MERTLQNVQVVITTVEDAKVVNMSLGGGPPSQEIDAMAANTDQGKIFVIAAGNSNLDIDVN